nr:hypothetical protein [Burkholderia glumae]
MSLSSSRIVIVIRSVAAKHASSTRKSGTGELTTVLKSGHLNLARSGHYNLATTSEIVSNSQNVQSIISSIARASTEQTRGVQEVNHAVMQLDAMVQQNAALVEETAAASTALQTQANALASAIGRFKID